MCSVVVVVKDVRVQQPLQMSFIQDDHMVKQIPATISNQTFANSVLPRTCETCSLWSIPKVFIVSITSSLKSVAIEDQVPGAES